MRELTRRHGAAEGRCVVLFFFHEQRQRPFAFVSPPFDISYAQYFTAGGGLFSLRMASHGNLFTHRWWGFIPLLMFALKAWQYRAPHEQYQLLWFCNAANLVLAVATFARWGNGVFVCTALLLVGLPIWVFDVIATGDFHVFSVFTHVLSPLVGVLVVRQLGASRHVVWQTLVFYLLLQLAARLVSPAAQNINVAFDIYAPVEKLFPNFGIYSLVNLIGLTAWVVVAHRLLLGRTVRTA